MRAECTRSMNTQSCFWMDGTEYAVKYSWISVLKSSLSRLGIYRFVRELLHNLHYKKGSPRVGSLRRSIFCCLFLHQVTFIHSISQRYLWTGCGDTGGLKPVRLGHYQAASLTVVHKHFCECNPVDIPGSCDTVKSLSNSILRI